MILIHKNYVLEYFPTCILRQDCRLATPVYGLQLGQSASKRWRRLRGFNSIWPM